MKNESTKVSPASDIEDAPIDPEKIRWERYETLDLRMPERAMKLLRRMARYHDTTCEALARQYIGVGLREAELRYFNDQVLWATEEALRDRLDKDTIAEVLREVRAQFVPDAPARPRSYPIED
jgi:hypothetical protein